MTSSPSRASERSVDAALLRRTTELAVDFLNGLDDRPGRGAHDARRAACLARRAARRRRRGPAVDVVEALAAAADPGLIAMRRPALLRVRHRRGAAGRAGGGLARRRPGTRTPGSSRTSPAASVVEEVAGEWLLDLLGLPASASVGLVTGCQMANFTVLAAARHARARARRLGRRGRRAVRRAARSRVVVGAEAHVDDRRRPCSTSASARDARRSRVDRRRPGPDAARRARGGARRPATARRSSALQAGNVNTGAFDPLGRDRAIRARSTGAWLHVDGAFGLWARGDARAAAPASTGIERADSWATDAHKWLNVPYDCGYRVRARSRRSTRGDVAAGAAYLVYGAARARRVRLGARVLAPGARASRSTRRCARWAATASPSWSSACCAAATRMAERLRAGDAGVEILNDVVLNQVLVRFSAPSATATRRADPTRVVRRVQEDGTCWLGGTTWHGMAAMRISISNWSTTEDDIDRSAAAILRAARGA